MLLSQGQSTITFFDQGIGIGVIAFCGCAFVFLGKRWFKQMDECAARDTAHLKVMERISSDHSETVTRLISQHHIEIIEVHRENNKERSDMVVILKSLAASLEALQTSITGMRIVRSEKES